MPECHPADERKPVTVLMGVYNGADYLLEMLDSLAGQDHRNWTLVASDDGSTDQSVKILTDFAASLPKEKVQLYTGPSSGFAANYLSMLARLELGRTQWVAFADQDDVWLPGRLSQGLHALDGMDAPALAAGPVWAVDADLAHPRMIGGWPRQGEFRNALVQNIVQGNAMTANPAAARILILGARRILGACKIPVTHDWWAYQIITGAGGHVRKVETPTVLYRQHGHNMIGANDTASAMLRRLRMDLAGTRRDWSELNSAALSTCRPFLTPMARKALDHFDDMRQATDPLCKLAHLRRLRLFRQRRAGTVALWLSAFVGRL